MHLVIIMRWKKCMFLQFKNASCKDFFKRYMNIEIICGRFLFVLFCHNVSYVHTFKRKSMFGILLLVLFDIPCDIKFKGQISITGGLNESIGNWSLISRRLIASLYNSIENILFVFFLFIYLCFMFLFSVICFVIQ